MVPKSVPVPMIRRVRLHNFRSIADCDVELGPLTLLVGPNGSGKSNFLHALDFLSDALNIGLESAVRRRGGMNSLLSRWALNDPEATLRIEVELELPEARQGTYSLALRRTTIGGFRLADESARVNRSSSPDVAESFHVNGSGSTSWHGTAFNPRLEIDPLKGRSLTLPNVAEHALYSQVYDALRGISCYSFNSDEMRRPQEVDGGERLKPDGSNIASVLERLSEKNDHGRIPARRIEDFLAAVSPGTATAYTADLDGYRAVRFRQSGANGDGPWDFTASEASHGTLRTLGVLVALYQGRMHGGSPVTFVGIEEPESAVHPAAATAVLEAMIEASLITQVIATTHSVAMLDYEDFDLDILRVVSRNSGRTIIGPIDETSRHIIEDILHSAGELLDMGNLKPADPDERSSQVEAASPA
jgi:predicted ATPase